jgi:hypothetical protein
MLNKKRKGFISFVVSAFLFIAGFGAYGIQSLVKKNSETSEPEKNIEVKRASGAVQQINIDKNTTSVKTLIGDGFWEYDTTTSPATLTLSNLMLDMRGGEDNPGYKSITASAAVSIIGVEVNVNVEGDNYLYGGYNSQSDSNSKTYSSVGFFSYNPVTFSGTGSLHVYGGSYKNRSDIGPQCSQGALLNGKLICNGPSLYIYGGKITNATNTTSAEYVGSYGLSTFTGIEVDKGVVHVESDTSTGDSYGWICANKTSSTPDVTVKDEGELYVTGATEAAYLKAKTALSSSGTILGSTVHKDSSNNISKTATVSSTAWTSGYISEFNVGTEKAKTIIAIPNATRNTNASSIKADNIINSYEKETLTFYKDDKTTLDNELKEYSTDSGATWTEFPGSELNLTNILTTSQQTLKLRYSATGTSLASTTITDYTLNPRRTDYPTGIQATIGTNSTTAKTFYLTNESVNVYQYQLLKNYQYETEISATKWTTITSSPFPFNSDSTDSIYVRSIYDVANNHYGSVNKIVSPASTAVLDLASAIKVNPNAGNTAFTVSGFTYGEHYSTDGGANWIAIPSGTTSLDFDPGTNLLISSTDPSTKSEEIVLSYVSKVLPATPSASVDYETEKLTGLLAGRTYSITSGNGTATEFIASAAGEVSLSALSPDPFGSDVSIVLKKDSEDIDSLPETVSVLARAAVPSASTYKVDPTSDGKVTFTNLTDAEEYSLDGGATWTSVPTGATEVNVAASTATPLNVFTYRTKATSANAASTNLTSNIPQVTSYDASALTYGSRTLSGLTANAKYLLYLDGQTDPVEITASAAGTYVTTSNADLFGKTLVKIVEEGDGTNFINSVPDTLAAPIALPTKLATPESTETNNGTYTIGNLTPNHYYLLKDSNNQTYTVKSDVNGKILIADEENTSLAGLNLVSITALGNDTDNTVDSDAQAINYNTPSKETAPSADKNWNAVDGVLSGLEAGIKYVLYDSEGNSYNVTSDANGAIDVSKQCPEAVGKTITQIAKSATDSSHIRSDKTNLTTSFKVTAHFATPTASFDQTTGMVTGLEPNSSYYIYLTDPKTGQTNHAQFNTAVGQTSIDLAGINSGTYDGTSLVSIQRITTDTTANCNSEDESLTGKVLPHEATPNVSYDATKDEITNITAGKTYVVSFDDGTSKEYVTSASDTFIDVSTEVGKTISSVTVKGTADSTSDSLSQTSVTGSSKILTKLATPDPIIVKDIGSYSFTNLTPGVTYKLIQDGKGYEYEFTADKDGKIVITSDSNNAAVACNIVSMYAFGDGSSTINSDTVTGPWQISDRATSGVSYDSNSGLISLDPSASYILYDSDGNSYNVTSNAEGKVDLATDYPQMIGKTMTSYLLHAHTVDQLEGEKTAIYQEFKVLPHLATPTAVFDLTTGILSGLTAYSAYTIHYIDAEGNKTTFAITTGADPKDMVLTDEGQFVGCTLTGISQDSRDPNYSNSIIESLTGKVLPHEATPNVSYDATKDEITNITAGKTYVVSFDDGTSKEYATSASDTFIDVSTEVGKTISSVTVKGTADSTSDSLSQTSVTGSSKILTKLATPDPSVASTKGTYKITGLTAGQTYILTDSTGATHEVTATADSSIVISADSNRDLAGLAIVSITAKGDQTSTIN